MIRVCDIDALVLQSEKHTTVLFDVFKNDPDTEEVTVLNEDVMISAHRAIDMIVIHKDYTNPVSPFPVISYVVEDTEEIHYEPRGFIPITVEDFKKILEFDTTCVEVFYDNEDPKRFVSQIVCAYFNDKIHVRVDTANKMVQYIPPVTE